MKTQHREFPCKDISAITADIFTEESIFFDIETTGFSPKQTSLYLIGCARRIGDTLYLDQFFAEQPAEEECILTAFFRLLQPGQTIITYNGIGFDIPYLKAKCSQYDIPEPFSGFSYLDMFKSVSKLKHIFHLENYRQKTIEKYLDIPRDDLYSGGELIEIYHTYTGNADEKLLELLLLHNYEDVLGMIDLLPMLSYTHIFQGKFQKISSVELCDCKNYDGTFGKELLISIVPDYPLPKKISCRAGDVYLTGDQDNIRLVIPVVLDALKYFYPNYKDYYYLPEEDTAIHKSVAAYVDKEHREQARASTCYTRKKSLFLPQFRKNFLAPAFYHDYGDRQSYFEYSDSFQNDSKLLKEYVKHLLNAFATSNTGL